jgi:phosphate transport system protein
MVLTAHTGSHYRQALTELRQVLLEMGGCAEECIQTATDVLVLRDTAQRARCDELEREIDQLEIEVDERCMKLLALHQPAASELRFVAMAMKIATDLERIGDLASNVAERASELAGDESFVVPAELTPMSEAVRRMITGALDSFVQRNTDLARDVLVQDDEVDELHWGVYRAIEAELERGAGGAANRMKLLHIIRDLERAADHATNIAEGVIYMVEGRT